MKIKFNTLKRYHHRLSFDNNTTFGIGNCQPLFCKFLTPNSKVNINMSQIVRLAPMVVPSFARLKVSNKVCFVPISQIFPAYDAFLSQTPINGNHSYTPSSLPCVTNQDLLLILCLNYAKACFFNSDHSVNSTFSTSWAALTNLLGSRFTKLDSGRTTLQFVGSSSAISVSNLTWDSCDFLIRASIASQTPVYIGFRLNSIGRQWFSLLRGLGYSLDSTDDTPLSILPLLAFSKAYYDLYQPKRFMSWHSTVYYKSIVEDYYNPTMVRVGNSSICATSLPLLKDFDGQSHFPFFASVEDDFVSACQDNPINSSYPVLSTDDDVIMPSGSNLPYQSEDNITADSQLLLHKLWNFVTKSSVVGQSVRDWFKVHLGTGVQDDMFDVSPLVKDFDNILTINQVVSTAQTTNGNTGDNLGALAGVGYGNSQVKCDFDTNQHFGFLLCISSIIPLSRLSCGNQPELCATTLYQQPLPDFDGEGYEIEPVSTFFECVGQPDNFKSGHLGKVGFGYLPRLSNLKYIKNIRSGGFALRSVRDSYIPYCLDTISKAPDNLNTLQDPYLYTVSASTQWRYPWINPKFFVSYNRLFYNVDTDDVLADDNFMSQSSIDISISNYLKPLSDSYSIEELRDKVLSVDKE